MIPEQVKHQAKLELARRDFWSFEQLLYPQLFTDERKLLKEMADTIQTFIEDSDKHYLVLSVPPGHFKSFTAKNLAMWLMGKDPATRVIGVANSGDLASMFSTQIRDTILGTNYGKEGTPYTEIFPDTKIKYGFATNSKWELEGSAEPSYRATSPTSAITGSRADFFIVDDIIKNHTEAMNANALKDHFEFYKNTLFSRTDGDNYKFIFVMQRWATNDLSGEIIKLYGDDVDVVSYEIEKDGKMLEPTIRSRKKFEEAKKTLDPNILQANYYQQPVDIKGRLYSGFDEWVTLPDSAKRYNTTDVADQGNDYLCSINWFDVKTDDGIKVYITDVYYSNEKAEITEPKVARMITADNITIADFESNNGGKGYARNVERELHSLQNFKTVVQWTPQNSNKEARILASSAWNAKNILMPPNWTAKYPDFASEVLSYVAGGKNTHDDGCFVAGTKVATIYGDKNIEDIVAGDRVITPYGVKVVLDSGMTGIKSVIENNGLVGTPDHKIFNGDGFERLDTLTTFYDTISICNQTKWKYKKLLYSMVSPTDLWDRESTILVNQVQIKEGKILKDFTERFGNIIQEKKYLKALRFITRMVTLLITASVTWFVYRSMNTLRYISNRVTGIIRSLRLKRLKQPQSGTKAPRGVLGTGRWHLLENGRRLDLFVSSVKSILNLFTKTRNSAHIAAIEGTTQEVDKSDTVKYAQQTLHSKISVQSTVQKNAKQRIEPVYNITVKDVGVYYANGVLVSNCDVLATIYERAANTLMVEWAAPVFD